jgi:hypothetical protein
MAYKRSMSKIMNDVDSNPNEISRRGDVAAGSLTDILHMYPGIEATSEVRESSIP